MPKAKELEKLAPTKQRAYRAIWKLCKKGSPSQAEIAEESGIKAPNLHPIIFWLQANGWIEKKENQHRSIRPLVKLPN